MAFKKYEDITVWQKGRELVRRVYALACGGSFAKDWGLRGQIQRAAVSVCSNITEGYARRGNREFVKFLWIVKGSVAEVQSQLYHALDLGYIFQDDFQSSYAMADDIQTGIFKLIEVLESTPARQKL